MQVQVARKYAYPMEQVYSAAKDLRRLASQIPIIRKVEILEEKENLVKAKWTAHLEIAGFSQTVSWVQTDRWDDEKKICEFEMTEGQFQEYKGLWEFFQESEGSRSVLTVSYELGLGPLGPFFQQMLQKMVRDASQMWLNAVEKILSAS